MGGADVYAMYAEAYTSKKLCMLSCALAYTKYQLWKLHKHEKHNMAIKFITLF